MPHDCLSPTHGPPEETPSPAVSSTVVPSPAVSTTGVPRRRGRHRRRLLAVGMTGLVVTSGSGSLDDVVTRVVPVELAGEHRPDPDIVPLAGSAATGVDDETGTPSARTGAASPASHEDAAPASGPVSRIPDGAAAIARWDGVDLYTDGDTTELVGFHESNNPEALPLRAVRPLAKTHHHAVEVPTTGESDGQLIVLPTRNRASGAMTAIDLAVRAGEVVVAPVTGVVEEVSAYQLYGQPDHKIWIRPAGNPDALISIIHINAPTVEAGDTVTAGRTPIAVSARQLAFESQVDRFTDAHRGTRTPHVHVEMRTAPAPKADADHPAPAARAGRPERSDPPSDPNGPKGASTARPAADGRRGMRASDDG